MAVQVNRLPPIGALQQRSMAPQITARGRQLQSSAPPIPKSGIGAGMAGLGKSLGEIADTIKESRQKANRRKVVESIVALDEMGEGDAFNAPAPTPMQGMENFSGPELDDSLAPKKQNISPATPKKSPLDALNMPDSAKAIFKDLVKAGQTDDAYKIALSFAMKAPKEYTLGKDQVVTDKDGKIIAKGPSSTPKPEKKVKAWNIITKQEQYATPTEINNNPNLKASAPPDKISDILAGEISSDIQRGATMPQLVEKYGKGVLTAYGNAQLKSQQPSLFDKAGITYTKPPVADTFFLPLPTSRQQERLAKTTSNMPMVNQGVGEPVVNQGQMPAESSAQATAPITKSGITVLELPLVQTEQDKIKMQNAGAMVNEVNSLSKDYRALVTEHGPQMFGPEAEKMSQAHTFLIMKLKDLMELGVLAGPDLDLLEKLITPPDDKSLNAQDAIPDWINNYDGTAVMLSQLDQLDKVVKDKYKAFQQNFGPIAQRTNPVDVNVPKPKAKADTSGWQLNLKKADK
ncbi:MAG: hypothetical protein CME70_17895 [Halobacteriovorax sp.]|nr:hypothetical protein [Halobacteriovorax sp.]|tara:strand:+ start:4934 stop:6484 length:1551 start_codon:yes stop_codon:yes gene_type:complete